MATIPNQPHAQQPTPASIGPYPIERELGRGGMGVVYLGRDPRLNRPVAIKVLPEEVARDPMRLSRFEREARTLAALNHRNVGIIYGLDEAAGQRLLILEYIPGLTLTARLIRGALPIEDALRFSLQIAEGLEAAHDQGVVHRDLKPDNIKITPEGIAKILDFGLATSESGQSAQPAPAASDDATTILLPGSRAGVGPQGSLTQQGMIMGTPGYMSPEQARGMPIDKRTDIWAFGCVLFECICGMRAFNGATPSDMLVAVIDREPDWNLLPPRTPDRIIALLRKSLTKDPRRRLRDIGDARIEIEELLSTPPALWNRSSAPSGPAKPANIARLTLPLAAEDGLANLPRSALAISPDGTTIAFIAGKPPQSQLHIRRLDSADVRIIPGTHGAELPFFSPDSTRLAFFHEGRLKRLALSGGLATALCPASRPQGACWDQSDTIYFISDWQSPLMRIPASGAPGTAPEPALALDAAMGELAHLFPEILPSGNAVLLSIWSGTAHTIVAIDLRTGARRPLVQDGTHPRFASSGHLVFSRDGQLMAIAFDPDRLEVFGQPVPVEPGILGNALGPSAHYSFSADGTLVFASGPLWSPQSSLAWCDRQGQLAPLVTDARAFASPAISPDGYRLAIQVQGSTDQLWLADLRSPAIGHPAPPATLSRLTFQGDNTCPIWSPDGSRLAFRSNLRGRPELFLLPADGGQPTPISIGDALHAPTPCAFTPDGSGLIFTASRSAPGGGSGGAIAASGTEIWLASLINPANPPRLLIQTARNAYHASLTPDGRALAFTSDETGREEVYVQPLGPDLTASPAGRRQITTEGGSAPRWSRTGSGELFYRAGDMLVAVRIALEPSFMLGRPRTLAQGPFLAATPLTHNYDFDPAGQRAVVIRAGEPPRKVATLDIVLNWFEDLKRKVAPPPQPAPTSRLSGPGSSAPGTLAHGTPGWSASIPAHSTPRPYTPSESATSVQPPPSSHRPPTSHDSPTIA